VWYEEDNVWQEDAMLVATAGAVPVTDGLIIHFRADDLLLSDGAQVSTWFDAAACDTADGTVKQAINADLPTFNEDALNGLPAVHFNDAAMQGVAVFIFCTGGGAGSDSGK